MRLEDRARQTIDAQLTKCGWTVQDYPEMDLSCNAVAVREFPLKQGHGTADYLLYTHRRVVGVVEAKQEGSTLTGVEVQTEKYSHGLPDNLSAPFRPLPCLYQSTGVETRFTNALDPNPVSREIFTFHRPETIAAQLGIRPLSASNQVKEANIGYGRTLLSRLQDMPEIDKEGLRACQFDAITNLEKSLAANRRRALVQMQTGSGKTTFAVAQTFRLLKYAGARRILFLVDRSNLARQTKNEFEQYTTPGDGRKFTELYNVQHLQSNRIDPASSVVITTVQRLYSILQGEPEFDADREETSILSSVAALRKEPLPVVYNPDVPIETFDFVFTDECHRSIYNLWRQVLEYCDAYLIGLTATPSKQTLGYFQQNLVMEYGHAQAVADGVNVDFDVYDIRTRITEKGATVPKGLIVDRRDRKTRKRRWAELDDDLAYDASALDRSVVAEDQIRTIIKTFKEKLYTEIFPGRTEVPKTLVFAKTDSHADDIVRIFREIFEKGNDFCEKITYQTSTARVVDPDTGAVTYKSSGIKAEDLLSSFRNAYNPRIAVTVDMIATGTDVKPLEIVFFMRDVQSSNYFEQMKGRGCRVLTPTEFRNVTPDGVNKSRYVIVDAVGVTDHVKSDSPSLERNPSVPLKSILNAVASGSTEPDVVSTLASRLARLDRIISPGQRQEIERLAGRPMSDLIHNLVQSVDADAEEEAATKTGAAPDVAGEELRLEALTPFLKADLRNYLLNVQQDAEQIIDTVTRDEVTKVGASADARERASATVASFKQYLEENRDEISAIQILYSRPHGKAPTLKQLKELAATIKLPPRAWTAEALWSAYEKLDKDRIRGHGGKAVTDLVSLIRFTLEQEPVLSPFVQTVEQRFASWLDAQSNSGRKFTAEQLRWLEMIRDHIAASLTIEPDDFELAPFNQEGGLGHAYDVFGEDLNPIMQELNEVLAA